MTIWQQARGTVYFLQVAHNGPIKIGFTSAHVHLRMRALQQTSPHELVWLGFFVGTPTDEREAHDLLNGSRCRSEWFYPTAEVLAFVNAKCASFDEATYLSDVHHADCLERVLKADRPYCRDNDAVYEICEFARIHPCDFNKWKSLGKPILRSIAEKAAQKADEIVARRARKHQIPISSPSPAITSEAGETR